MCEILDRFRDLTIWSRGGERAPHKPLLILLALAEFARGHETLLFSDHEDKLAELLKEFGPTRKSLHPEYPFFRLSNDGLWTLSADFPMRARLGHDDPTKTQLRAARARGGFPDEVREALRRDPKLISAIAQDVLERSFPETLHEDILAAVGLDLDALEAPRRRRRDPNFRNAVLVAYQHRCAACGLDVRLGSITVGLEAAHLKWHQADGPDSVDNGVCFCATHHKPFDFGAFTLSQDHRLLVSEHVNGRGGGRLPAAPSRPADRAASPGRRTASCRVPGMACQRGL
jgi:putative restriction endonuclease